MTNARGSCDCGNVRVEVELARAPAGYTPRACDCDFCTKHGAAYISDPDGALRVRIADERECVRYRQGSEQAEFLVCRRCGVLVAVFYDGRAAINAKLLDVELGREQPASPKQLAPDDKVKRWRELWFARVDVSTGD